MSNQRYPAVAASGSGDFVAWNSNTQDGSATAPALMRAREVLRQRSTPLAPLLHELKDLHRSSRIAEPLATSVASYVHMHVNRLLRADHRRQELVLYDHLERFYESQAMRASH